MNDLEIINLCKEFPGFQLKNINIHLPKGSIMGLIGPNGSGKTTTLKLILNMLKRSSGEIKILGLDNCIDEIRVKESIGVVFDSNYFVDEWSMVDVEKAVSMFYRKWDSTCYYKYLGVFNISKNKRVKELSKGMQMKLMLACAFSYDAKLLILDEPTSGLDPVSRDELLEIIRKYVSDKKHSVLFSTHITGDLEKVANYITFINFGNLIYSGEVTRFLESFRSVKGKTKNLTEEMKRNFVGVRYLSDSFEAMIKSNCSLDFKSMEVGPVTMDEIIVFTSKGDV